MKFVYKQLALKLKDKGFDRPCFGYYFIEDKYETNLHKNITCGGDVKNCLRILSDEKRIDAPTIEQVLEWLREDKKIHISIDALASMNKNFMCKQDNHLIFDVRVSYFKEEIFNYYDLDEPYFKYEDACIAGIEYIVEHLI